MIRVQHPAIVLSCNYNGLAVIQELGKRGVPVLALDSSRSVGSYSRYAKFILCPDPKVEEKKFVRFLEELGATFTIKPALFPTNDEWAVAISRNYDTLSKYFLTSVAEFITVQLVVEKQRFYDWAFTRNLPVPRSWKSTEIHKIPDDAFPLAAKPEFRRMASDDKETKEISKIKDAMRLQVLQNRAELDHFVSQYIHVLPHYILQEYVAGLSDCMYTVGVYANRQGEVLGLFSGRKVRGYPPDVGDCVVGQVENVPSDIKDLVKRVCKELNYHGIAEFEFKRDVLTGEFRLIEINPRSWSWVGITPACGVSLAWIAYCDITGLKNVGYTESTIPDGSVKWVKITNDAVNCLFKNRSVGYPQWHMGPVSWWRSLRANRLVIAEFSISDPMPTIHVILNALSRLALRLLRWIPSLNKHRKGVSREF